MKRSLLAFAALGLILGACAPAPQAVPTALMESSAVAAPAGQNGPEVPAPAPAPSFSASGGAAVGTGTSSVADRVVVKTASRTIVVNDPAEAAQQIAQLAQGMGGFVVSMDLTQVTYAGVDKPLNEGNISVRIPASRLDEALRKIEALAVEVRQREETGEDATAQYRKDMDIIGRFVGECLTIQSTATALGMSIYTKYVGWCKENGTPALSSRRFYAEFKKRQAGKVT